MQYIKRPQDTAIVLSVRILTELQIESVREQRTVYIENDCLRGTDSDESPT